jgi:hypothetical protein
MTAQLQPAKTPVLRFHRSGTVTVQEIRGCSAAEHGEKLIKI